MGAELVRSESGRALGWTLVLGAGSVLVLLLLWWLADGIEERVREETPAGRAAEEAPALQPLADPRKQGELIQVLPPLPETWDPQPDPGLELTLERSVPRPGMAFSVDHRRADFIALHVPRGGTVSPFLGPGPFKATWRGSLRLALRDRFSFRAEGKGHFHLEIGGMEVFDGRLEPGKPLEAVGVRLRKGDNEILARFVSDPFGYATVRLSWRGSEFPYEPVHGEVTSHDSARPALARMTILRRGRALFAEARCASCHLAEQGWGSEAMPELAATGPVLEDVGKRSRATWLPGWLADPQEWRQGVRMPRLFRGEGAERDMLDIVAHLVTDSEVPDPVEFRDGDAAAGRALFQRVGCLACHDRRGVLSGERDATDLISLDRAAERWHGGGLVAFLADPRESHPFGVMPYLQLTGQEARQLAAFLLGDGAVAAADPVPAGDGARGKELIRRHGCMHCHVPGEGDPSRFPPLQAIVGRSGGCLDEQPGDAPDFGFSGDERQALRLFVRFGIPSLRHRVPAEFAQRKLTAALCTSCHSVSGAATPWSAAQALLPPIEDPDALAGLQTPPRLTWIGAKLQHGWLTDFLTGEDHRPTRDWMQVRMPVFARRGELLATGLAHLHGYSTAVVQEPPSDPVKAALGRRLSGVLGGFNCFTCHGVGDREPTQVFETRGINFTLIHRRLRPEFYYRWMADPLRIAPESKMPKYPNEKGKTFVIDVFDGDSRRQFEAIWEYLRSLR